ncbi:MAG: ATP-binding protein [Chloroflexi bacterium]|nr:ATP-binding protein [Chloroflexota bacterium]
MQEKILSPHAASLSQSMRDLGYSLETAIADLIDNSITAGARNIRIFLDIDEANDPCLVIIDDGSGMNENELIEAMRPGSRNPRDKRDKDDLGRFGLGLKTASFSQCKSLTVVSRKDQNTFAACWDLDLITARNEWIVTIPAIEDLLFTPYIKTLGFQGTYILWKKLDRFLENSINDSSKNNSYDKLSIVEKHLALVFHRYISGDYKRHKINIEINGHPIIAFDPFCISNKATQLLQEEIVRIDGNEIKIQPYILPHHSKLSKKDYDFYRSRGDFVTNQGAYIYRNGRLMAWGDWFRLVPKSEATKLARIQIDFTNVLDEYWTIDIKKSRAHPPPQVREKLKQIINRITDQSKRIHIGRGNRLFDKQSQPLWVRFSDRDKIRYEVNKEHVLINAFLNRIGPDNASILRDVISLIERSVPLEAIYADYSSVPQSFEEKEPIQYEDLKSQIMHFHILLTSDFSMDKENFKKTIFSMKQFNENRELTQKIIEELL